MTDVRVHVHDRLRRGDTTHHDPNLTPLRSPVQGAAVIQAGEVGECMYFINSGVVQVLVNGSEVDRLNTGDFFGEIALTVSKQRTADVKSLGAAGSHGPRNSGPAEPLELFQLLRTDFEAAMDKYPILKTRLAQIGQVCILMRACNRRC